MGTTPNNVDTAVARGIGQYAGPVAVPLQKYCLAHGWFGLREYPAGTPAVLARAIAIGFELQTVLAEDIVPLHTKSDGSTAGLLGPGQNPMSEHPA